MSSGPTAGIDEQEQAGLEKPDIIFPRGHDKIVKYEVHSINGVSGRVSGVRTI